MPLVSRTQRKSTADTPVRFQGNLQFEVAELAVGEQDAAVAAAREDLAAR